jgi:hypothetical protein
MMYGEVQTGAPRRRAYRSGQQVPLTTFLRRIYRCVSDNEHDHPLKSLLGKTGRRVGVLKNYTLLLWAYVRSNRPQNFGGRVARSIRGCFPGRPKNVPTKFWPPIPQPSTERHPGPYAAGRRCCLRAVSHPTLPAEGDPPEIAPGCLVEG